MLKKVFQVIGLALLIGFSFFYTEKVVMIVRNQDPLMIKIQEYKETFNKNSVNAFIENDSIIPGINACVVDANSSYNNMKKIGSYNASMIEYREVKPKLSIENVYDKYIIKGNKAKNEIALVLKLNQSTYLTNILSILSSKSIKASFFIDGKMIEDDTQEIYSIINQGHEIYNSGYDGSYDKDLLIWTNNMIENMSYNKSRYCLSLTENKNTLEMCSKNKMYTIKSNLIVNLSKTFGDIKANIEKGSIIVFDVNDKTGEELEKALLFFNSKGYTFNLLSKHLSEKGCEK